MSTRRAILLLSAAPKKRIADPGASIVRVNIGVRLVERATVGPVRKTIL